MKRILTIIDLNNQIHELDLGKFNESVIRLGRSSDNEIVLNDSIISKYHGQFLIKNEFLFYRDVNQSNGTFIENCGERKFFRGTKSFVKLYTNSVLRIGNLKNSDQMMIILFHEQNEDVQWRRIDVRGTITIGREMNNNIVVNHPAVKKVHCKIEPSAQGLVLQNLCDSNGVFVNGKLVNNHVLKDKDVIQLMGFQILYSNGSVFYQTTKTGTLRADGVSLNAIHINKFVGSGLKKKQILTDVSCEIKPNEFVAIIGGSGAGKTTLMNAISGFEPEFKGQVFCNGIDMKAQFSQLKNMIGFVPQQDIIYENLTLKKMLYYTAKLKMPKDISMQEINSRIEKVLSMVDLQNHANTYIRKLSGGQKKRASIAVELLADPKLFFLDEPTSGLDPGTEQSLMNTLQKLSKTENKTIVMVTHTTQNLHLCDKVIFMGPQGRLCFMGNVEDAKRFFNTNDVVNIYNMIAENPEFWQQKWMQQMGNPGTVSAPQEIPAKKKESWMRQFMILLSRNFTLMKNDFSRLLILLIQPLLIALLLWVVSDENIFNIYESTKSMMFSLSCSAIWIGLFNSIQEICKERTIIKREYMSNLKLSCYILSKFVIQMGLGLIQAIILVYVFLGLAGKECSGLFFDSFNFEILFTVWLTILASASIGFVISSVAKTGDKAMVAAPFVLIIQLLFSGILFELKGFGEKISYFTVSRWSVEALGSITNLNDLDLRMQEDFPMLEHEAESIFEATKAHVCDSWLILLIMMIIVLAVSMITLRRIAKDRR